MSTAIRLLVGVSSLGGVAGGAYLLHQQLSTDNIESKLKKNKYEILPDDSEAWVEIFKEYEKVAKTESTFKFGEISITNKEELREQCKKILKDSPSKEENYKRSTKWCTVPKSLKEVLGDKNYISLNNEDSKDDENTTVWNEKITLHNDKAKNTDKRFINLGGENDKDVTKDKTGRDKIRKICRDLEIKKHYEQDFENNLEKAVLWCTEIKKE